MNTTQMGSFQTPMGTRSATLLDTSCGYLLQELHMIWDEVGEDEFERENALLDLEQEYLEPEKMTGTLKEQLDSISPALREMQLRKDERVRQFQDVQRQIQEITAEIAGKSGL